MYCVHIIKYYLAVKSNEVLIHAATIRMNLKSILSERSYSEKFYILYDSIGIKCPELGNL